MFKFRPRARSRSGNSALELSFVLLPMLALFLAIVDFAVPIFLKSMFTSAVREGCRFGITYQLTYNGTTYGSQTAAITAVVQGYSLNFLSGSNASLINVQYYSPTSPFSQLTGTGANDPGNILQVSVNSYQWTPIVPLWRSGAPMTISAVSADRLEGLAAGASPPTP
jgi:Flp pilus assembly protein TadG